MTYQIANAYFLAHQPAFMLGTIFAFVAIVLVFAYLEDVNHSR